MVVQAMVTVNLRSIQIDALCQLSHFRRRMNSGGKQRQSRPTDSTFVVLVYDDRHVFSPSTAARHAHASPRDASPASWYAFCCARRSFQLAFASRGACLEIAKVDSDAEETIRPEEKRRIY